MSTPPEESLVAEAPSSASEVAAALAVWQGNLRRRRNVQAVDVRLAGDAVTVTADIHLLRELHAAIEVAESTLTLSSKSRHFTIPLLFFEAASRVEGGRLVLTLTPRSDRGLVALFSGLHEAPSRDLWPGILRMVEAAESTAVHAALVTRLVNAVAEFAHDVEERVAADSLSASSDALTIVRLLEQPQFLDRLRETDPLAPARLRSIGDRKQLLEMAGGALSSEQAAEILGLSRQAVDKRRRAGKLLAISFGKRGYRYPAFQFVSGGVIPGLDAVLKALEKHDPWMQLSFLVNRDSGLNDEPPATILARGDVEAVVAAAAAFAEHGAA